MAESKYANKLRELGFTHADGLIRPKPGEYLHGRPIFMMPGSDCIEPLTLAVDETGQAWECRRSIDLTPYGFESMWHSILTPLKFRLAPDYPGKKGLRLPAYFNFNFDGSIITMAIDASGKCWQKPGFVDLSGHGFNLYSMDKPNRIWVH